jgi:hypothetical protein
VKAHNAHSGLVPAYQSHGAWATGNGEQPGQRAEQVPDAARTEQTSDAARTEQNPDAAHSLRSGGRIQMGTVVGFELER